MKTIFISSFHALISRNILQTSVLETLLRNDVRVVLLVPTNKEVYFRDHFANERILVEGIEVPKRRLEDLLSLVSMGLVGIENHIVRGWKTDGKYFHYYGAYFIHVFFARFFFLHRLWRHFSSWYLDTRSFANIFSTYHPDLVVATDTFSREDRGLVWGAKKNNIPVMGLIRSWDNPTTKGVLLAPPDHIVAPNEVVKEELISIHHIDPHAVTITGVPHYDHVFVPPSLSREEFCRRLGLNPQKKIILFAPGGKILYKHDAQILSLFKRNLDNNSFSVDSQFLVRLPPSDRVDTSSVSDDSRFVIDEPGINVTGRKKESELTTEEQEHLHTSLYYSDVVVTLASTMAIDGMVYDKPVIVMNFEPERGLADPISKFARYVHLKKFLGSGLVEVSNSEAQFIGQINEALTSPARHTREREIIREKYAYRLDGGAGARVAESILSCLRKTIEV